MTATAPVILGVGHTEYSMRSGRSELRLALEAAMGAVDDAGLSLEDVDGLVTSTFDSSSTVRVAGALGLSEVTHHSSWPYGGGGAGAGILDACRAVESGAAEVVVVYRALNERSGWRYGRGYDALLADPDAAFWTSAGVLTPAHQLSLVVHRYMHEFGLENRDFAPVSVAARKHAATNPDARFFGRPITTEDHQRSHWIVEPVLRLLDCCMESDGAAAVVVTSAARARGSDAIGIDVVAGALGMDPSAGINTNFYGPDVVRLVDTAVMAEQLWRRGGLGPDDIDVAILYDNFTPLVLMQLEAMGFCKEGEGRDFVVDGAIEVGGRLPVNTHGGLLGEAYIHGINGVIEAVRQLRGTAVNQVRGAERVIVTGGPGLPTSGLLLGRG